MLRVAGLQMDIEWEQPEENLRRALELAEQAVAAGARLLVLPEMFATGFSMRTEVTVAAAGQSRRFMETLASDNHIWVAGGYAEQPEGGRPRNACSVFDPGGCEVLRYHKVHPFSLAGEHELYEGGDSLATALVDGVRVTPVICYDLRFPELFRAAAPGTDLFLVPANWPDKRSHAWRTLLKARAMENQAYVLGVNRVGVAQGHDHRGDSALVGPMGDVLASCAWEPAVVTGEVRIEAVARCREHFSFLADRRPEVYLEVARGYGPATQE